MEEKNVVKHICDKGEIIKEVLDKVNDLEKSQHGTDILIEVFTKSNNTLSKTLRSMEQTMLKIQSSLENNVEKTQTNSKRIDKVEEEFEEEKGKNYLDIREVQKNKLKNFLTRTGYVGMGAVGVYGVAEVISLLKTYIESK